MVKLSFFLGVPLREYSDIIRAILRPVEKHFLALLALFGLLSLIWVSIWKPRDPGFHKAP